MRAETLPFICDDDKTQAPSMHKISLTVDERTFEFDVCSQGCGVRLVHAAVIEVLEGEAAAARQRRIQASELGAVT